MKIPAKNLPCGHIIRNRISTGMAAVCWRRRRPAFSLSRTANFTPDTIAPGWRWLELHADGSLTTKSAVWQARNSAPIPLQKAIDVYAPLPAWVQQLAAIAKATQLRQWLSEHHPHVEMIISAAAALSGRGGGDAGIHCSGTRRRIFRRGGLLAGRVLRHGSRNALCCPPLWLTRRFDRLSCWGTFLAKNENPYTSANNMC